MTRKVPGLLVIAAVYGCIQITIATDTSFNSQVQVAMGGLSGQCRGSATVTQDAGQAVVTRMLQDDGTCRVEVAFSSTLIVMSTLRQQVEQKIRDQGKDPGSVKLAITSPCTITITNMTIGGVTLPSTAWSTSLMLLGEELAVLSGDDIATLPAQSISIPLSDANIAALNTAYNDSTDIVVDGVFTLENVSTEALAAIPAGVQALLSFDALAEVHADATVDLF